MHINNYFALKGIGYP